MAEVARPPEGRGAEALVAYVRIGAQAQQRPGQLHVTLLAGVVECGLPRLVDRQVGAASGVDVEAHLDEQLDGAGPAGRRHPDDQARTGGAHRVDDVGSVVSQARHRRPVVGEQGGDDTVGGAQPGSWCAVGRRAARPGRDGRSWRPLLALP